MIDEDDEAPRVERIRPRRYHGFKKSEDRRALKRQMAKQAARDAGCRKIPYPDKATAEVAMARIASTPGGMPRKLTACYHCRFCGTWHTTSQEQRRG